MKMKKLFLRPGAAVVEALGKSHRSVADLNQVLESRLVCSQLPKVYTYFNHRIPMTIEIPSMDCCIGLVLSIGTLQSCDG